jgi:hypothetical protein
LFFLLAGSIDVHQKWEDQQGKMSKMEWNEVISWLKSKKLL